VKRSRDPAGTRERLLQSAFERFHMDGYEATALRDVVHDASTTSGALFHHFDSKDALALAVINGPVAAVIEQWWIRPLHDDRTAFDSVRKGLAELQAEMVEGERRLGCPLGNAAIELANGKAPTAKAIRQIFERWHDELSSKIADDRAKGRVAPRVRPAAVASLIIATIEGAIALTKTHQSKQPLADVARELDGYFRSLEGGAANA
jgi:TetR/AcrR family transcriptional regulator, transcriptional repressor for nem operon